jgi:tetratricopeptide (TPR) repeat protein
MGPAFDLRLDPLPSAPRDEGLERTVDASLHEVDPTDRESLVAFRRAIRLEPNDPDYYFILGEALARAGRHADAVPALREAIRMSSDDASYHYALGAAFWHLGRDDEAAQSFREASRLRPDDLLTQNGLGAALTRLGHYREAVRALHVSVRLDESDATAYCSLGAALWGLGRRGDSLQAFRRACRLDPSRTELRRNLARALSASGYAEEAAEQLRQAVRERPDDLDSHLDLAECLYAGARYAEARTALDEALEIDPACLRGRPASQDIQDGLRLARLREEVASELPRNAALPVWATLASALSVLTRGWRELVFLPHRLATWACYAGIALVGYLAWRFAPPYFDYYVLKDRIAEVAGAPVADEADIVDRLRHAIREQGLETHLAAEECQIETRHRWRTIRCEYRLPVELLPGLARPLRFEIRVERPFLAPEGTIFF